MIFLHENFSDRTDDPRSDDKLAKPSILILVVADKYAAVPTEGVIVINRK
jgi:hypothetical protein